MFNSSLLPSDSSVSKSLCSESALDSALDPAPECSSSMVASRFNVGAEYDRCTGRSDARRRLLGGREGARLGVPCGDA